MDAIEAPSKKQKLDEAASMNISMNADDASQVGQLMAMMRNAGMDAKPVSDMPLSPRMDMEKNIKALGNIGMDDNPDIPGKDDVAGDQDLKAGALGALAGSLAGGAAGQVLGKGVGDTLGTAIGGAMSGMGDTAGQIGTAIGKALPSVGGAAVGGMVGDKLTGEADGDYANSPEERYAPYTDMTNPPSNDLNKAKKSYPKVAGGDNPMALADKIKEELSSLYKEYK